MPRVLSESKGTWDAQYGRIDKEIPYGSSNDNSDDTLLGPSAYKTLFVRGDGSVPNTTIGGLCVVYSGDLPLCCYSRRGPDNKFVREDGTPTDEPRLRDIEEWAKKRLPRLDQVMDAIGPTRTDTYVCVFEDSFFARLIGSQLGLDEGELTRIFREVSEQSAEVVRKWLRISTDREVKFVPVYTSDIEGQLEEYVQKLASEVGDQQITELDKSKITMMYTYLWPQLLRDAGYLQDESVLCCEPYQNFLEVALPKRPGFFGIGKFLRENPWGQGKNEGFQAAGYIPMIHPDYSQFSRNVTYTQTVNRSNAKNVLIKNTKRGLGSPLPLTENPLIRQAVNLLFPFEESRKLIGEAVAIEAEFRRRKSRRGETRGGLISPITVAARQRIEFDKEILNPLEKLAYQLEDLYRELGYMG